MEPPYLRPTTCRYPTDASVKLNNAWRSRKRFVRRMIVKGSLDQLVEEGAVAGSYAHPTPTPTFWAIVGGRKCHNAEVIHKLRKRRICPGLDCLLHTSTQEHMPALRLLLTFGMALAIGIANVSACTDKPTMLDRVSCEHRKFMATVRATPYPDLVYRYGVHRKALAADLDDRKITPEQFEARGLELSSGLANALIQGERTSEERGVQAQKRAAAAAELPATIEVHKLCLRVLGRPCPPARYGRVLMNYARACVQRPRLQ